MSQPIWFSPKKIRFLPNLITWNNYFATMHPAELYSKKRLAFTTRNGYCKSQIWAGSVSSVSATRHAVALHLVPCMSCLEKLITSRVLSCVCVVGD